MSWLRNTERRLAPFAVSNIIIYIVLAQTFVYLTTMLGLVDPNRLTLVPALVRAGEWWRLVTFIADPPAAHWLFIAFALYFLYLTGSALESAWGTVRFNAFLLLGYVLTVGVSFLTPYRIATNMFIGGSIFLAFAHLHPNFTMYIFFILPVQIKWLALLAWLYTAWSFFVGDLAVRMAILAAVTNFFVFLGKDLVLLVTQRQRRSRTMRSESASDSKPRHVCFVCGKTNLTNPEMDFRYCTKCSGDQCYCPDHIRNHPHVVSETR